LALSNAAIKSQAGFDYPILNEKSTSKFTTLQFISADRNYLQINTYKTVN